MGYKKRRQFLKQALFGGAGLLFIRNISPTYASIQARVEILIDEPIGKISPELKLNY